MPVPLNQSNFRLVCIILSQIWIDFEFSEGRLFAKTTGMEENSLSGEGGDDMDDAWMSCRQEYDESRDLETILGVSLDSRPEKIGKSKNYPETLNGSSIGDTSLVTVRSKVCL